MRTTTYNTPGTRSALGALRSLVPVRRLTADEALRVAELQAARLLAHMNISEGPVPSDLLSTQPRLRIVLADLPVSGTSHWSGEEWIIALARHESPARQRFTMLHEYKHVIDHGRTQWLYQDTSRRSAAAQAEQAADYFAGCVLVPRRILKRVWGQGLQRPKELAAYFEVSVPAIEVRLAQTGLTDVRQRCITSATSSPTRPNMFTRTLSTARS